MIQKILTPNQKYYLSADKKTGQSVKAIQQLSSAISGGDMLFVRQLKTAGFRPKSGYKYIVRHLSKCWPSTKQMILCLCNDFRLTKQLLELFVKIDMMKQLTTLIKLFTDNFHKEFSQTKYHKDASAINVAFVAEQQLKHLYLHKQISYLTLMRIMEETKGFLSVVVKKLQEGSPLNYKLLRNAECLNPLKINEDSNLPWCLVSLSQLPGRRKKAGNHYKHENGNWLKKKLTVQRSKEITFTPVFDAWLNLLTI